MKTQIGSDGLPYQTFQEKIYRLYPGERYFSRGTKRLHRTIWEAKNGKVPKGQHVHHVDGNPWNNLLKNLALKESHTHHSEHRKQWIKDNPAKFKRFYTAGVKAAKAWHSSEEGKAWHRQNGIAARASDAVVEKVCEQCSKVYKSKTFGRSRFCHTNCKAAFYRRK